MLAFRLLRDRSAWLLAVVTLVIAGLAPLAANAQGQRLVRDAEIEGIIQAYSTPLFQAAGLDPRAVEVYLIDDESLNAFVTAGQKLFIHTGLLMRAETPLQVIGVIAHETGHIAGGHTVGRGQALRNTRASSLLAYVLGVGAAVATGQPGLGSAIILGGQDLALKGLLSYSRNQEQAADQAAVRLLSATEQSPVGMLEFMRILGGQEILLASSQDPYLRTHPLSRERVTFMERELARSRFADAPARPEFVAMQARMRAKLIGFLKPTDQVLRRFPESDDSANARYARAIAYYRLPDLPRARVLIDDLLAERPDDPYFHELKGQMLFESGQLKEALPAYETAVSLLEHAPQLRLALAHTQIEINDPALDAAALENLDLVLKSEPRNAVAWRLSAIAYGRKGDKGMTSLALAEEALLRGKPADARNLAGRAQNFLAPNSAGWLRAQDVSNEAARLEARQKAN